MFSDALARVSREESPAVQWRLLRRAERLALIDGHQAILAAASAAEVCLASAIRGRLQNLPEEAMEQIITNCGGIAGLIDLVEGMDGGVRSESGAVKDRLAGPRNRAAHRGETPDKDTLQNALEVVRDLLDHYSPAPSFDK
jgi:hypothetical protein